MTYPIEKLGGSGQVMHFGVANGFPPRVYTPLLTPFMRDHCVISLPPRALWGEAPPQTHLDWRESVAQDLLKGLHHHNLQDVIAVGHSFGGIASMLAIMQEPTRFKALILLDPTILSHELIGGLRQLRAGNAMHQMPLAARALRRRRDFNSAEEAFTYFRERPLFADWGDDALRLYVTHGTQANDEGGVSLTWTPEWEAYYFMTGYTDIWEDLTTINGLVPTLILRGSESDTFITESAKEVQQLFPSAHYEEIAGHGHLFPMTNSEETYKRMRFFLDAL